MQIKMSYFEKIILDHNLMIMVLLLMIIKVMKGKWIKQYNKRKISLVRINLLIYLETHKILNISKLLRFTIN